MEKCEEKGETDRSCYGLIATPISLSPLGRIRNEEIRSEGMKLKLGKREGKVLFYLLLFSNTQISN